MRSTNSSRSKLLFMFLTLLKDITNLVHAADIINNQTIVAEHFVDVSSPEDLQGSSLIGNAGTEALYRVDKSPHIPICMLKQPNSCRYADCLATDAPVGV